MTRLFDAKGWMWSEALAALERADRSQRRLIAAAEVAEPRPVWEPLADVFETGAGFLIVVALPGIRGEQVHLIVEEAGLLVRTRRDPASPNGALQVRRMEIPYGSFERRIPLPRGRYVLREQRMVDGCLELLLARE